MSETGRRLRALFEEIAPPIDIGPVMAAPPARGGRRRGWVIALAAAVVVLVGGGGWLLFLRGGSQPVGTSVPLAVTTTATPASDQLMMACGQIVAPYADTPPAAAPLSTQAEEALAALGSLAGGSWYVDIYEWGLWEESESELLLLGKLDPGAGLEEALFAHARFAKSPEGEWRPQAWGQCHWWADMEGWGPAEWTLDPAYPLDENTTTLHLLATERACANGQAPEGRRVTTVVWAADSSLTVIVLVEPVAGGALCPGNPQFPVTVDLEHAIGDSTLLDGATIPAAVRNAGS